jgi:hypothetical protein
VVEHSNDELAQTLARDIVATFGPGWSGLDETLAGDGCAERVQRFMATSEPLEHLYKRARVGGLRRSGFKQPDYAYVGLQAPDGAPPFDALFDALFAPRLAGGRGREPGFRRIFEALARLAPPRPLIVETGCLRLPGNWGGDGQSTFMWDAFARSVGGDVFSIDVSIESIDTARRACSGYTNLIHNDSVFALSTLSSLLEGRQIHCLYLDSFDLDPNDPMPSAIHHAQELAAARPLLKRGSIVCIDDYRIGDAVGGKGAIVDPFMRSVDAAVLHDGYAKVWQLR